MKSLTYSLLLVFLIFGKVKAQTLTKETLTATNQKLEADVKIKNQEITDLRKEALAKKLQAIKDKTAAPQLKSDALLLEQKVKEKQNEIAEMRKQISDNKKQIIDLGIGAQTTKQTSINTNITKTTAKISTNTSINYVNFVEIFELPNYQGKSFKLNINTENNYIKIPFASNNISFKFSNEDKMILFIAQESNKAVRTFLNSYPSLNINSADITSIIVGTKKKLELNFNGLIYRANFRTSAPGIHNSDCKKIYGDLAYKLEMKMRVYSGWATSALYPIGEPVNRSNDGKINIFNLPKYKDFVYPYVYNEMHAELAPQAKRQRHLNFPPSANILFSVPDLPNATKYFYVDSASYIKGKNKYDFTAFVKIGSAHKYCDACTDFTWDAEMKTTDEVKLELPYAIHYGYVDEARRQPFRLDFLQVGPFRGENYLGQPTKQDNFTGPPHTTFIQFTAKMLNP